MGRTGQASLALQRAVFELLTVDTQLIGRLGGAHVYDAVPRRQARPYVSFGRSRVTDWSTGDDVGGQHTLTLHVWTDGPGRRQALEIADDVERVLTDAPFPVADHCLVAFLRTGFETERLSDREIIRASLRFRALLSPNES